MSPWRESRWFIFTVLGVAACSTTEGRPPPAFPSPVQATRVNRTLLLDAVTDTSSGST